MKHSKSNGVLIKTLGFSYRILLPCQSTAAVPRKCPRKHACADKLCVRLVFGQVGFKGYPPPLRRAAIEWPEKSDFSENRFLKACAGLARVVYAPVVVMMADVMLRLGPRCGRRRPVRVRRRDRCRAPDHHADAATAVLHKLLLATVVALAGKVFRHFCPNAHVFET